MNWRDKKTVTAGGGPSSSTRRGADEIAPGTRVGRFVVESQIGAGAMGVVYRARDPELGRDVALKVLATDDEGGQGRARMLREAKAIARLEHPNVVSVYEVGALDEANMYFAMQFVDGQNLADWLRSGPHASSQVIDRFVQAGQGLAAAHDAGLVHRDFKPANVLVDGAGRVHVADFGLAQLGERDAADEITAERSASSSDSASDSERDGATLGLTKTGALVGTPRYMSPEQFDRARTDARTDQFSYCVALWEALSGEHPFWTGDLSDMRAAMRDGPPRPPKSIPARVASALRRGLAERPDDRFPSMRELLRQVAPPRRRRTLWAATGLTAAAAIATGVTLWVRPPRALTISTPPCISAAEEMRSVWGPARRAQVRESFARHELDASAALADRFIERIDERVDAWIDAYDGACRATLVEGRQSDEAMDLRQACLLERRDQLGALVDGATSAALEPADLQEMVRAAVELEPLEWCDDVESLRDFTQLPRDPALREQVVNLRAELDRLELHTATHADEKPEVYDPLIARARRLGYAPLLARALHDKAVIYQKDKDVSKAEPIFREAISVAAEGGDAMQEGFAWVGLARVLSAEDQYKGERQAQIALEAARARARRAADPHWLLGAVDVAEGNIAMFVERDHEKAGELFDRGLAHFEQAKAPQDLEVARVERSRSMVFSRLGEHELAERSAQRALTIIRETLGDEHALVASAHYKLMSSAYYQDDFDTAMEHAMKAYEIRRATGGPDDYYTLLMANAVAACLLKLERHDEALEWSNLAVDGYAKNERDGARMMVIDPLLTRARAHLALGDGEAAEADVRRGLEAAEPTLGAEHPLVKDAYAILTDVAETRG